MYCTNCGKELRSTDARFCDDCCTAVETEPICSKCGSALPYFVKYCPKCGEKTQGLVFDYLYINYKNLVKLDLKNIYIEKLYLYNSKFSEVRLHNIKGLIEIKGVHAEVSTLDITGNTEKNELTIDNLGLTHLNIEQNSTLEKINCSKQHLISLNLRNNTALKYLECSNNQLTSLDLSNSTALAHLECSNNQLASLILSHNTKRLDCTNNRLTSLDLSHNTDLTYLCCSNNQLTSLDLSHNTDLRYLECSNNQLTSLDLSHNTALRYLICRYNRLTSLDLSHNTVLSRFDCSYNFQLTSLDVSNNMAALTELIYERNPLKTFAISNSQQNKSWMNEVKEWYPDIEIIVK